MKILVTRMDRTEQAARREFGFTLMELLIAIAIVLLVTLIAIPNMPGMRMHANENSAIAAVRSIYQAETQYAANYPAKGFACSLSALGSAPGGAPASPLHAQVLPNDLADGIKSGYTFSIVHCAGGSTGAAANNQEQHTGFEITAVPQVVGKTGHRGFCEDTQGTPKADPGGGANCTLSLQ